MVIPRIVATQLPMSLMRHHSEMVNKRLYGHTRTAKYRCATENVLVVSDNLVLFHSLPRNIPAFRMNFVNNEVKSISVHLFAGVFLKDFAAE